MSDLQVEYLPLSELLPYARNSRTHTEDQIAEIAGSIREFGFVNPVLISGGNDIIAGHGRVRAAAKLDMAQVPCIRLGHLTATQRKAYVIADNRLALNAGWDVGMLSLELKELDGDFDLQLLGFDEGELAGLLADNGAPGDGTAGDGDSGHGSMADKFGVPPFSVLDARQGYWQERKRYWLGLGIQSELGRGGGTWRKSATGGPADRQRAYHEG